MKERSLIMTKYGMTPEPRGKGALYVAFTAAGILGGLFTRDIIDGPGSSTSSLSSSVGSYGREAPAPTQAPLYEATIAADIYNLLHPTATATSTPRATETPTPDPLADRTFCGDSTTDGDVCKVPYPPPETPTPYPECPEVIATPSNAGDWCVYRAATPGGGGE